MGMNNKKSEVKFESVMNSRRNDVIRWLIGRYNHLAWTDAEDIVQESSLELWKKIQGLDNLETDIIRMWKIFSRNTYTHWVSKKRFSVDWDDQKLQYGWEERDFGWSQGDIRKQIKREKIYEYLDNLSQKERMLMEMVLQKKRMTEISSTLGYSSAAVVKNTKHRVIVRMRESLQGCLDNETLWLPAA